MPEPQSAGEARGDAAPPGPPAAPVRIIALPDGPLLVEGPCVVVDSAGNPFPPREGKKPKLCLCRCGASAVKPWCDGSHKRVGFKACEVAR
jgi:CDGSH-type Zn-finger protein